MRRRAPSPRRARRGSSALGIGTPLLLIALVACAGLIEGDGSDPAGDVRSFTGRVTRVVDGDTFWLSTESERIRVWGLAAPEANEPGGSQATATLSNLVAGRELTCRQRDIDRYNRPVGQCFLPDGRDVTALMIESGTATEYCRYSHNHYGTC